jgi:hypothetical protein
MTTNESDVVPSDPKKTIVLQAPDVPWQVWVVVAILGLEGFGNLLMIPSHPIALYWLAMKVLLVTGLIKAWRWVFILFLVVAAMHVIAFLGVNLIASAINFAMMALVASANRYFFRRDGAKDGNHPPETLEQRIASLEAELSMIKPAS